MDPALQQAALTSIGGVVVGILTSYFSFRGKRSHYEATVFGAAERVVERLEAQVKALQARNDQLEESLENAEKMIRHLHNVIDELSREVKALRGS
jgi:predicted RNase H-like nuclease (RuvC/YqgF family)